MAYPKRTLKFRPTRGAMLDVPAWEVGPEFYTGVDNALFRNGFAQRVRGHRTAYDTVQTDVLNLINARAGSTNYWVYHGTNDSYVVSPSAHTDITISGGLSSVTAAHQWTSTLLNGVVVSNNTLDAPMYWPGSPGEAMEELPGWPSGSTCGAIVAFRYHLFALRMEESGGSFPMKLLWSDAAEPGTVPDTWASAKNNEAGDTELSDTPGEIRTAVPLRGSLLIYKTGSLYAADYIGGNDIFSFRTLFTSMGALSKRAVCDINGQHLVVGDGDVYLTDGTNLRSIATLRARNFIFDNIDQTNYEMLFTVYNRPRNEVWVCFPETNNDLCTLAAVYDVSNDAWGFRELPSVSCGATGIVNDDQVSEAWDDDSDTWDSDPSLWNTQNFSFATESVLLGVPDEPEIMRPDTEDAVAVDAVLRRHDLTFDAPERVKFVKRLHVRGKDYGTLFVRVGSKMNPEDSITWSDEVELVSPNSIVNAFAQGRYISVEIRSADTSPWTITGFDIEAELRGYH